MKILVVLDERIVARTLPGRRSVAAGFNLRMAVLFQLLFLILFCPFSDVAYSSEKVVLQLRWDHQFQFAGYYAAFWQGYYREAGLDVEIRSAITSEHKILRAVQEVAEGRADFGVGAADILVARDQGAPLVLLAVIFQQSAARFFALKKTDLRSPSDLLRLRVARNLNDLIDVEFQAMLRAEGIDPAKVKAYSHEPGIDHLVQGRVDVVPGYSTTIPYYSDRLGLQLVSLAPSSYGIDFYGDSLFTHERFIKAKPEIVERFKQASLRGWRYALENSVIVADRITQELPRVDTVDNVSAFNRFQIDQVTKLMFHPVVEIGHVNEERWQRMQATLRESGIVHGALNPAAFFYDPGRQKREWLQRLTWIVPLVIVILLLVAAISLFWNRRLAREIDNRKQAEEKLRESEGRLRLSIDNMLEAYALHEAIFNEKGRMVDYRFLEFNPAAQKISNIAREEIVGRTALELYPHIVERGLLDCYANVMDTGVPAVINDFYYEGDHLDKAFDIACFRIDNHHFVCVFRDITDRKRAEEKIKASLVEKETMLKEIHHRVKNNLQVISSLLNIQSSYLQDGRAREALQDSMARVRTMAMIHTQLYQSKDLNSVDCVLLIRDLIGNISQSYGRAESPIEINIDADETHLSIDTSIPCGLILNELVTNALKHAFPGGKDGEINIRMRSEDNHMVLTVQDNGIGFPESIDLTNVKSLGVELVNILVKQMNGKIDMQVEGGTTWTIAFPIKIEREWRNG